MRWRLLNLEIELIMTVNKIIKLVAVDNDKTTISLISKYFQKMTNVRIRTFTSPKKCLYYIRSQCKRGNIPDAIIIDRTMVEIPGEMLSVMIKEINTTVLNILHTGADTEFIETDKKCYQFDAAYQKNGTIALDEIMSFIQSKK